MTTESMSEQLNAVKKLIPCKTKVEDVIHVLENNMMSAFVAGPIYSSWMFRINSSLINQVVALVKFPNEEGIAVDHTPWEMDLEEGRVQLISDFLGLRAVIVDAIDNLVGGYPPATFKDTFAWMTREDPEKNQVAIKQSIAKEWIDRRKRGDTLHSTMRDYVESEFTDKLKRYKRLIDCGEQALRYLEDAQYVKSRSETPYDHSNLPEWVDEMAVVSVEEKFPEMYKKKLMMLDRKLSKNTRMAVETELSLMEEVAKELGVELPSKEAGNQVVDMNYLKELGMAELEDEIDF